MVMTLPAVADAAASDMQASPVASTQPGPSSQPVPTSQPTSQPTTRREPVVDEYHGVQIVDEYRWLEGDATGKPTGEVRAWTEQQNRWTRHVLDRLPGRAALERRVAELLETTAVSAPQMAGHRLFFTRRSGREAQSVVLVQDGDSGQPRVLVDPNALDSRGLVSLGFVSPNQDGSLLAFGLFRAGDENTTCHLLDVDSGTWLADEIPGKVGGIDWLPDGRHFIYSRLADVANPYSRQIRLHRVGRHHRHDELIFEQLREGPLATTWGPFASLSRDGRWLHLGYFTSTRGNDLWVVDFDRWRRTGELVRTTIAEGIDARFGGTIVGDTLLLRTDHDAPNGVLYAVDLHRPERDRWRVIIPHRDTVVLESVSVARGVLVADTSTNAQTRIERYLHDGTALGELELPGIGTASVSTNEDRSEVFLSFSSFTQMPTIFRCDALSGQRTLWHQANVPVDPGVADVRQVWYTSRDGTRVSMFLVHRKGLEPTGDHPTILSGYGGFNISMTPSFNALLYPWIEAGGVFAVANLRGGGEYGSKWHRGGQLEQKQNTFDDFIAAAEYLIDQKITRPQRLVISGGSNGGLLVGAVAMQRPELFAGVVCMVPLLDMLRYEQFLMARFWVPEYGSAQDPAQFKFLRAYSPYQQIRPLTAYPAMLITAGENDTRVHPLHARKMAAALQAAQANADNPILLWVDTDSGHGGGKPLDLRIRDAVDLRLFAMWRTGMLSEK